MGNLLTGLAHVLGAVFEIYFWVIFARAILSWIRPNPYHPIVRLICGLVDPVTYRISRIIPTRIGMIDISPFILMIIVMFLKQFVVKSLYDLGMRLG
jgi:YggT family protein